MIGQRHRLTLPARIPIARTSVRTVERSDSGRLRDTLLLAAVVVTVTALNVWWRTRETRPPHWDMGHHLANSLEYLQGFSLSHPLPFIDAYNYFPPLVYWVADAFYAALGNEAMWVAILSNVVWLAMLVFATYGIGRTLWNARVGLLSVAFVLASPLVVTASKEYMLDVPLTAVSALGLYLLIRAKAFSSRRYSLLFGLACGLGLLVKWTLPLVLGLPVLHAAAGALAEARQRRRFDGLLNLACAAALTFAVAGTWYVHNAAHIAGSLTYDSGGRGAVEGDPPIASLESVLSYAWDLLNWQLYLVPFAFAVAGVVFCVAKRGMAARNVYPILAIVGTYVLFTLVRNKDPRFTMPLIPPLAVVATSWLEYVSAKLRAWAAVTLVTYAAVAFLAISFGTALLPKQVELSLPATSFGPDTLTLFGQHGYLIGAPTSENWHQADPFTTMARYPESQRRFAFRGPDTIWFNKHGLSYYALRDDATWTSFKRGRFLIARGREPATPSGFTRLDRWRLPDGGTLALYVRTAGAGARTG